MGKNERQAYLKAIRTRYRRARKRAKVAILDSTKLLPRKTGYSKSSRLHRRS